VNAFVPFLTPVKTAFCQVRQAVVYLTQVNVARAMEVFTRYHGPHPEETPMDASTLMTPELTAAILDIVPATQGHIPLTLGAARYAIEHERIFWSSEGELLHPQDRTSLVIELDELIDRHGMDAAALKFMPARRV
jgi:hypothetical protein